MWISYFHFIYCQEYSLTITLIEWCHHLNHIDDNFNEFFIVKINSYKTVDTWENDEHRKYGLQPNIYIVMFGLRMQTRTTDYETPFHFCEHHQKYQEMNWLIKLNETNWLVRNQTQIDNWQISLNFWIITDWKSCYECLFIPFDSRWLVR